MLADPGAKTRPLHRGQGPGQIQADIGLAGARGRLDEASRRGRIEERHIGHVDDDGHVAGGRPVEHLADAGGRAEDEWAADAMSGHAGTPA